MAADDAGKQEGLWALSRFAPFGRLDDEQIEFLKSTVEATRTFDRGEQIHQEGKPLSTLDLLVSGWAASVINLSDGKRQIVNLNLPGDTLALPGLAMAEPLETIVALTPVKLRLIPISALTEIFSTQPRIAAMLFLIAQEERAFAMERIALMAHASAQSRFAAWMLRISERLQTLDESWKLRFSLPLTQRDLADLIGVSTVHVNGLIKHLRNTGIITLDKRELSILDLPRLKDLAKVPRWRTTAPHWLP